MAVPGNNNLMYNRWRERKKVPSKQQAGRSPKCSMVMANRASRFIRSPGQRETANTRKTLGGRAPHSSLT